MLVERTETFDDLTGKPLREGQARRIRVIIGEEGFLVDGSPDTIKKLRSALQPFIARADRIPSDRDKTEKGANHSSKRDRNRACREWASKRGHEVSERGVVPKTVMTLFLQANPQWRAADKG